MGNGISTIVFIVILGLLGYFFWASFSPYYFHDVTPNAPMQVVINGKPWYFPMGYIDPHYPNDQYVRGGETQVWLSLDAADYKIIPQDVAKQTLAIGPTIDVILTSDQSSKTKKALQEFAVLKKQTGFTSANYGLQAKVVDGTTEYMSADTRISCGHQNCTLFTTRVPDVRTVMVFNMQLLPGWSQMIDLLITELQPFRQKPPLSNIIKDLISQQPTGIQRTATVPNSQLLPPGQDIPEVAVPSLNTK
jgi:hypothetical protein